jgi:hypothetical protein
MLPQAATRWVPIVDARALRQAGARELSDHGSMVRDDQQSPIEVDVIAVETPDADGGGSIEFRFSVPEFLLRFSGEVRGWTASRLPSAARHGEVVAAEECAKPGQEAPMTRGAPLFRGSQSDSPKPTQR